MTQKIGEKVPRKIHFPLLQFDSGKESLFDGLHEIRFVDSNFAEPL